MKPIIPNLTRPKGDPKILEAGPSSFTWADRAARDLGWISIGLGLTQLFGARMLTRKLGMWGWEGMTRACGAREIASGCRAEGSREEVGCDRSDANLHGERVEVRASVDGLPLRSVGQVRLRRHGRLHGRAHPRGRGRRPGGRGR